MTLSPIASSSGFTLPVLSPVEILLQSWGDNPAATGNKQEACQRIRRAIRYNSTELSLDGLGLNILPDVFGSLAALTVLDLSGNQLQSLPDSFRSLVALTRLDLSRNQLRSLPPSFGSLVALTRLDLSNNHLQSLPASFESLVALTELNLVFNQFQSLPASFGSLVALTELYLSHNQLQSLPDSFTFPIALTHLYLEGNQLQSLPDSFGSLVALTWLNLKGNQLRSLPDSFGSLVALTRLDLSSNQLRSLPDSFGSLVALTHLYLEGNQLQFLPASFGSLVALIWLNLKGNQLRSLQDSFGSLVVLTHLSLGSNQLRSLPESFGSLVALTQLSLGGNQLQSLPDSFGSLVALTRLSLGGNQLQSLPDSFGSLVALTELDLGINQFQSLPDSFGFLVALTSLSLRGNQFQSLPESFGSLVALTELDLADNRLQSLPDSFRSLVALRELDLADNQLLSELPLSLGNIHGITYLDVSGTGILRATSRLFLRSAQVVRASSAVRGLPKQLEIWSAYAGEGYKEHLLRILAPGLFTEDNQIAIHEWLNRLAFTSDFRSQQRKLATIACKMLVTTSNNPEFRELFLTQISINNERCGDRAAMALNELYVSWRILCDEAAGSPWELLAGAGKTLALRVALAEAISQHIKESSVDDMAESVETYLHYESSLRERLKLLTAIESTLYARVGRRDWINEEQLIARVEATYLNHVVRLPAFELLAKDGTALSERLAEVTSKFQETLGRLGDCPEGGLLDESVLSWKHECGALQQKQEAILTVTKKEWFLTQLAKSS